MKLSASQSKNLHPFERAVVSGLGTWSDKTVFLAAVSGGSDSTAMLSALAEIKTYKIYCLHVNHNIRPPEESLGDALAVKDLCKSLNIPCKVITIPQGLIEKTAKAKKIGIEAAARYFRHKAWNKTAVKIKAERILVAHTQDDLLENILMRILRGSGPAGLSLMPRERGKILRPILQLTHTDILAYLKEKRISYRTDSTNEDIHYLRNRIRHKLVPCLDSFFPYWRKTLISMAETQTLTADFINTEASKRIIWQKAHGGRCLSTPLDRFFSEHETVREEALFQAIDTVAKHPVQNNFEPDFIKPKREKKLNPRRKVVRLCAQQKTLGIDAGCVRIEKEGNDMVVFSSDFVNLKRGNSDYGCTLVIREAGIYTYKGLRIECGLQAETPEEKELLVSGKAVATKALKQGFVVDLPVVFRISEQAASNIGLDKTKYSEYIETNILVEDSQGTCAYILSSKKDTIILLCGEKEEKKEKKSCISFVIVSGGIDV